MKSASGNPLEEPNALVIANRSRCQERSWFRLPSMVRVYVEMKRGQSVRCRGPGSRRSPSLSSLTTTLPVMAQIDIEYAGRTYTVPWTDDNVERLKGVAQHVRDGRAEVFTVLGDGFALTIVVGPTIPLAITYVD